MARRSDLDFNFLQHFLWLSFTTVTYQHVHASDICPLLLGDINGRSMWIIIYIFYDNALQLCASTVYTNYTHLEYAFADFLKVSSLGHR